MGDASAWHAATANEESLWLLEKFVPDSAVNNVAFAFRVPGTLRRDTLNSALRHVVSQHEALRTRFRVDGSRLVKSVVDVDVSFQEITDLAGFANEVIPLDGRPLLRAGIHSGPDGDSVCLVAHHLVFDAMSAFVLGQELASAYDAIAANRWPVDASGGRPVLQELSEYWRDHLDGFDPDGLRLNIETRDSSQWTLAGSEVSYHLRPEVANVIRRLRKELRAPDAVVLLAAYYVLLASHGAGPDLVVGCPFTTRDESSAKAIGFHVNVLPLRAFVDRDVTFRGLTRTIRTLFLTAMDNTTFDGELPQTTRTSWRNPIFRHVFNYVPTSTDMTFQIGGMTAEQVPLEARFSKFDLEFFLLAAPDDLRLRAVYSTEVHDQADVEALLRRYEAVLLALDSNVDRPIGEIPLWAGLDWSSPSPPPVVAAEPVATVDADDVLVQTFVGLWKQMLTRDDLDADSNFFANGGQSLIAALLAQRAEEIAGIPIPLAEFFTHATPATLAAYVRASQAA